LDNYFEAFNAMNGLLLYATSVPGTASNTPIVANGMVYVRGDEVSAFAPNVISPLP
jgi:hypothetical protein